MTAAQMSSMRRGRPRDPAANQAILDAALEEYADRGWEGFTIDGVSRRSGFGKSTIYLRWKDKDALLTESLTSRASDIEDVDTGSLRGDLEGLAAKLLTIYLDPLGWAMLRLMVDSSALSGTPERFDELVLDAHMAAAGVLFDRAVARGEIAPDPPTATLIECLYGGVTMSAVTMRPEQRDLSPDQVVERVTPLIDLLLAAVQRPGQGV